MVPAVHVKNGLRPKCHFPGTVHQISMIWGRRRLSEIVFVGITKMTRNVKKRQVL